jgi:hypothetical protein
MEFLVDFTLGVPPRSPAREVSDRETADVIYETSLVA